jgi:hypothetical protein
MILRIFSVNRAFTLLMDVSLYIYTPYLCMPPHTVLCVYIIIHYHHTLQLYLSTSTGIQYLYTDMVIYGIWPHNTYTVIQLPCEGYKYK